MQEENQIQKEKETGKCCCCFDIDFGMKVLTGIYSIIVTESIVEGFNALGKGQFFTYMI